jgi:stage II sporulation protein D
MVRVLVLEVRSSVKVRLPKAFYLGEEPGGAPLRRFERGGDITASSTARGEVRITMEGKTVHEAPVIVITPAAEGSIYINGKPYRGGTILRTVHGGIITINYLNVDEYIKGVLPAEIGYLRTDQYEAYRAQAIASRSYAVSKLEEKQHELYDLKATIMDQVYRGVQGEHPEASRAVDETSGTIGLWQRIPVRAYYCACCGGHTADIRLCWPWKEAYPYLFGVRDAPTERGDQSFCRRSPHFRWRMHWSGGTLERVLKATLPAELGVRSNSVGKLLDITVEGTAPDGRVEAIEIVTDRSSHRVEGDRIRWVLRANPNSEEILRSTLFKVDVKKTRGKVSSVNLVGGGNGHGVGMCQAGAIAMAEQGFTAEEILKHYYPGITIQKVYF